MTAAFIIPIRNKAPYLREAITSALDQDYDGELTFVLSDQGSIDGSREISHEMAQDYSGPYEIILLDAPDAPIGNSGINAQLNWLNEELSHDYIIFGPADDIHDKKRARLTVDAFASTGADYVASGMVLSNGSGTSYDFVGLVPRQVACESHMGLRSTSAWRRSLLQWTGPLTEHVVQDLALPIAADFRNGMAYVREVLQVFRINDSNTSAGWRAKLALSKEEHDEVRVEMTAQRRCSYRWLLDIAEREDLDPGYYNLLKNRARSEGVKI